MKYALQRVQEQIKIALFLITMLPYGPVIYFKFWRMNILGMA
jgi:hypothetical protein